MQNRILDRTFVNTNQTSNGRVAGSLGGSRVKCQGRIVGWGEKWYSCLWYFYPFKQTVFLPFCWMSLKSVTVVIVRMKAILVIWAPRMVAERENGVYEISIVQVPRHVDSASNSVSVIYWVDNLINSIYVYIILFLFGYKHLYSDRMFFDNKL